MSTSHTPLPPAAGVPCFVCGLPLIFTGAAAISGHASAEDALHHIQFHRGCAPQLAAEALLSLKEPRPVSSQRPFFRRERDSLLEEREKEILYCLASGLSNGEIGRQLGISSHTARNLVSRLLLKLDVSSRTEAAVWAITHDIVATRPMLQLQRNNVLNPAHPAPSGSPAPPSAPQMLPSSE